VDALHPVQVLDFSRERMADRSNGILEFSVNHDFQDANVFHFWERYTSNASLGQHNTQPEVTQFMENVSVSDIMVASIRCKRSCSHDFQQLLFRCLA
jgi:quinol monooxygenase YgiN